MARTLKVAYLIYGEEMLVQRPGGAFRNILSYPVALIDDNGLVTGALNTLINITEKRIQEGKQVILAVIMVSS